jgi:hypothetical protein
LVGLYQDLFVDPRRELGTFIYMKITKRPVQTVWTNNPVEEGKMFTGNLYKHKEWMDNEEPIQIQ